MLLDREVAFTAPYSTKRRGLGRGGGDGEGHGEGDDDCIKIRSFSSLALPAERKDLPRDVAFEYIKLEIRPDFFVIQTAHCNLSLRHGNNHD